MFNQSSLATLMDATPAHGVSIFMPTHMRGSEIRQDPIRLKNLATEARGKLMAAGLSQADADGLLAPAWALVEDYGFWQHQSLGLVLFLSDGMAQHHKVPVLLAQQVVVAPRFHLKPLLPVLTGEGAFLVLTITADRVRVFEASRFAMAEAEVPDLPQGLDEVTGEGDYENPLQASPTGRPTTGPASLAKAQVYGDSPEDWRKNRRVEFVRRISKAMEAHLASNPAPVVLVANAEAAGHVQKLTALGPFLAGMVQTNPEAMDEGALHRAAYGVVQPQLGASRTTAVERFHALLGADDIRAASGIEEVARAAYQGRADTVLLAEGEALWGQYDPDTDEVQIGDEFADTGEDLLDAVALQTLRHGGRVHMMPHGQMPTGRLATAIMRY